MMLVLTAEGGKRGVVESKDPVVRNKDNAVRITHRDRGYPDGLGADGERIVDDQSVLRHRDIASFEDRLAHIDGRRKRAIARHERDRLYATISFDGDRIPAFTIPFVIEPRQAADAVAAHLAPAAVGVIHLHPGVGAG